MFLKITWNSAFCALPLSLSHRHTHTHTRVHAHIDRPSQNSNFSMRYNEKTCIFLMMLFCHPLSSRNFIHPDKHTPGLTKCEKLSKRYKCFHLPLSQWELKVWKIAKGPSSHKAHWLHEERDFSLWRTGHNNNGNNMKSKKGVQSR